MSYREIVKSTSIFGGVQFLLIMIQLIRSKFIAILLGPFGMGISSLLLSTTEIISSLSNLGLSSSAVKNIAEANSIKNTYQINLVITVLFRLITITGTIGLLVVIIFSPFLSQLSFGSNEYILDFCFISVILLFNQLNSFNLVVLQGLRKLKMLALCNLFGSLVGAFISIPLYFLFKNSGIVPAIIISSIVNFLISSFFTKRLKFDKLKLTFKEVWLHGKQMIKLGFLISASGLLYTFSIYLLRLFISNSSDIEFVGLYNAGFAIINTYVSLIFTAMSTDYYPRLASVSTDNLKLKKLINQQVEVVSIIIVPILIFFIINIQWLIKILYSDTFVPISNMVMFAAFGMILKAGNWAISFIFLAKGNSKLFFYNSLSLTIYSFVFNLIFYFYFGLVGLGYSFVLYNFLYLIQVYLISLKRFNYNFSTDSLLIFTCGLIVLFAVLCLSINSNLIFLSISYFFLVISIIVSFNLLNKRINLVSLIKSKFNLKI